MSRNLAKECQALLESMQERMPIDILKGKKNIECRPAHTNKGEIVKRLLYTFPEIGFALCAGDDKTDEDMFRALKTIGNPTAVGTTATIEPPQTLALYPILARSASADSGAQNGSVNGGSGGRPTRRRYSSNQSQLVCSPKLEPVISGLEPERIFSIVIDENESRKTLAEFRLDRPEGLIGVLSHLAEL